MSKAVSFEVLSASLKNGKAAPVTLVHGEEGYYTDQIVKVFEKILPEEDREFNQYILYGPQTSADQIIDVCRRYPMMADRQVVIVKELQSMRADQVDKLVAYIEKPSPTTVLLLAARGEKAKGAKFLAAVRKSNEVQVMESKKVYENALPKLVAERLNKLGLNIQPKALEMLVQNIGTDLSRMFNEIDKLVQILGHGATVTPEAVERHIGISKDYNAFELVDALARCDYGASMRIVTYFRANPKAVAPPMLTGALFSFFSDMLVSWFVREKSDSAIGEAVGNRNPYHLKRLATGRQHYNAFQAIEILRALRRYDAQSKGIGSRRGTYDLLQELVFRITTAPGNLFPKY